MTRGSVWGCEAEDSWLRVPAELVDALLAEHAARCAGGAWSRPMAALYLRRCQDKALLSARYAFPSLRQLAAMWGWTVGTVRGLLQREVEWGDPHKAGAWLSHPRSGDHDVLLVVEAIEALGNVLNTATTQPQHKHSTGTAQLQHKRDRQTPKADANTAQAQHSDDTGAAQAQHSDDNTGAVHRSPTPITNNKTNSPQPPAERGALNPLVESVVGLLLDMGPLSVTVEAKQRARLLDREAVTIDRLFETLQAKRLLPKGAKARHVADAAVLAVPLWVERRTWTPGVAAPAPTVDEQAVSDGLAVAARLEQEAAERSQAEDEPAEAPQSPPEDEAWIGVLALELADAWERTRPPVGDQLRAGHEPAIQELRRGLLSRGRLAIGKAPLEGIKRAVRLAFEHVDARQAVVEVAA